MPASDPQFRRELAELLNRHGVDNQAHIPDFILADMIVGMIPVIKDVRVQTARWLGEKVHDAR